jgi:hypothetical protein
LRPMAIEVTAPASTTVHADVLACDDAAACVA